MIEVNKSRRAWKYEYVVGMANEIVDRYPNLTLTLRQLHYRIHEDAKKNGQLEYYPNTESQYKHLSDYLVKARKKGDFAWGVMEDRTRDVLSNIAPTYCFWKDEVKQRLERVKNPPYFWIDNVIMQDRIPVIVLEKQALEGIFTSAIKNYWHQVYVLVVCRGYNSLTQLKEFVDLVKDDSYDRDFHCYFFSDFDPSGIDIQRNFLEQGKELGVEFSSFNRIALTKKQIGELSLPYAPVKRNDSRSNGWKHSGVVELDALDPNYLVSLIEDCLEENINQKLEEYKEKVYEIQKRRAEKLYKKKLLKLAQELLEEESE